MKLKSLYARAGVLAAFTAVICAGLMSVDPQMQSATAGVAPRLLSGTVVGESLLPLGGAQVIVRVEKDETFPTNLTRQYEIARTTTDEQGNFELSANLDAPATVFEDGSVRLEIMTVAADKVRRYLLSATPPSSTAQHWTWPSAPDAQIMDPHSSARPQEMVGQPITDLAFRIAEGESVAMNTSGESIQSPDIVDSGTEASDTEDQIDTLSDSLTKASGTTAAVDLARTVSDPACSGYWEPMGVFRARQVPVHWNFLANRSKVKFEWGTTQKTRMEVGYAGTGSNYAGGFSASTQNESSANLTKSWDGPYTKRFFAVQWKYEKQRFYCIKYEVGAVDSGERRWVPHHWTTGTSSIASEYDFTCSNANKVRITADEVRIANNRSVTFSGFFSIAGVKLDATQSYETRHVNHWILKTGHSYFDMCGNGADPGAASIAKEVLS